jgi:hypothetical protein
MKHTIEQLITSIENETYHDERLKLINELEHLCYIQGDNPNLLRIVRVLYDVNEELEDLMSREGLEP